MKNKCYQSVKEALEVARKSGLLVYKNMKAIGSQKSSRWVTHPAARIQAI
jgi:hypothetical protein